jgi:AraC-like DNA-binding protein
LPPGGWFATLSTTMRDAALLPMLDAALRGGTVAVLLLLTILLGRDHRSHPAARLGIAFALSVGAYVVCSTPGIAELRASWHIVLVAIATANPVLLWLFARALFDDAPAPPSPSAVTGAAALWGVFAAGGILAFFARDAADRSFALLPGLILALGQIVMAGLALASTVMSWRGDLVEGRRRLRVFVVGVIAAHTLVNIASDLLFWPVAAPDIAGLVSAAALLLTTLAIAWPLTRIAGDELFARPTMMSPVAAPLMDGLGPTPDAVDTRLLDMLMRLMTVERIQRREGLTIGALAARLAVPEYRLRRLINRGLGHRNFNSFLNHYRIEETKLALADPAQAEVPVLTIALDAGFQSLGPFNRAFKAETGLTPTDYRRLRQARPAVPPSDVNALAATPNFEIGRTA